MRLKDAMLIIIWLKKKMGYFISFNELIIQFYLYLSCHLLKFSYYKKALFNYEYKVKKHNSLRVFLLFYRVDFLVFKVSLIKST